MIKKVWTIFALFSILFILASCSQVSAVVAKSFDVCPSGCNYSTIQAAVNDAGSSDKIKVTGGTYNEHIIINKSVTIEGDKSAIPAIDCSSIGTGITINGNSSLITDIEIKNCNIGIELQGGKNQIYNTTIHNTNTGIYVNSFDNKIIQNRIFSNNIGIVLDKSSGNAVNYNDLYLNSILSLKSNDIIILNAKFNWWGDCNGPGALVTGNVDFSGWLGVCATDLRESKSCIVSSDTINLLATITTQSSCIGKVIFMVNKNGIYQNFTGLRTLGGDYMIAVSDLPESANVLWKVYAEDCNSKTTTTSAKSFYTRSKTKLTISPTDPNGENGWYTSKPVFTLSNPDASQFFYRWDASDTNNYAGPFSIESTPNNGNVSGGIFELNYYSNVCNESAKKAIVKVDITPPLVKNMVPKDNDEVISTKPLITAAVDEYYNGDSGVNKTSIIMKLDNEIVDHTLKSNPGQNIDATVSYTPTDEIIGGMHYVHIYAKDLAGNTIDKTWKFSVAIASDFNLTINSPKMNSFFSIKRAEFNMTTTRIVEKLEYRNNNDRSPKWILLCKNCNEYGNNFKRIKSLNEGDNTLVFRATDKFSIVKEETVTVKVKSQKPKIINTLPKKDSYSNGSIFSVKYSEAGLKSLLLFVNGTNNQTFKELFGCESGTNKECITSLDLSEFNGLPVEYYFVLKDIIDSEAVSKKTKVNVDTSVPIVTINSPLDLLSYGRVVPINVSVSEMAKLEFMDNFDIKPKWTKICTSCNSFGVTKKMTKSFLPGNHQVTFKATDKAGNTGTDTVSFTVN